MKTIQIVMEAGASDRRASLVRVPLELGEMDILTGVELKDGESVVPCEFEHRGRDGRPQLLFIAADMKAGESRTLHARLLHPEDPPLPPLPAAVELSDSGSAVEFRIGGEPFTTYHYGEDLARPFLHPVLAAGGLAITRGWPMQEDVPGESKDHPHHRGLWVAHGDVNGIDNWSEERGHGTTVHQAFDNLVGGPIRGHLDARAIWRTPDGTDLLAEERQVTAYSLPGDIRFLDLSVHLTALVTTVTFGDTKEGGICSVRVATTMDAARGGRIEDADGRVGEKEAWGKRSAWCDYSGPVQGQTLGVAILDHPENFRHPTYWHVRDYGLMTANPFGASVFTGDANQDGRHALAEGEKLSFRYGVIIHPGSASDADVAGHYAAWAQGPSIAVSQS